MSGHSHWSTIQRQKGANDAKRAKLFTKLSREVSTAARDGGTNPDFNPRLRLAVQRARDAGVPNDNIERILKRIAGGDDGSTLEEIWYEGYGTGGAAILVQALTDNRNRTSNEVRSTFSRQGGNIGEVGSVSWIFDSTGTVVVEGSAGELEDVALSAIDAGAEDVGDPDGGQLEVYTTPSQLETVRATLLEQGARVVQSEISMRPKTRVDLEVSAAKQNLRLLERLDELDDVQQVYTNANFPSDVIDGVTDGQGRP